MSYLVLFLAGCMEICGVVVMRMFITSGKRAFLLLLFCCMGASFLLLSVAMREISAGSAYAIWTGIGAGGGVIVGVLFLGERRSVLKLVCVGLIVACSVGLKLVS